MDKLFRAPARKMLYTSIMSSVGFVSAGMTVCWPGAENHIRFCLPSSAQDILVDTRYRFGPPPRERGPSRIGRRRHRGSRSSCRAVMFVAHPSLLPGSRACWVGARPPERRSGRDRVARVAPGPGEVGRLSRDCAEPPYVYGLGGRGRRRCVMATSGAIGKC